MNKITIYGIWGTLSHEKEYWFTSFPRKEVSYDIFEVELPDGFSSYKTALGDVIVQTPSGEDILVNDIFAPGQKPSLRYHNKNVACKFKKINQNMMYDASYL